MSVLVRVIAERRPLDQPDPEASSHPVDSTPGVEQLVAKPPPARLGRRPSESPSGIGRALDPTRVPVDAGAGPAPARREHAGLSGQRYLDASSPAASPVIRLPDLEPRTGGRRWRPRRAHLTDAPVPIPPEEYSRHLPRGRAGRSREQQGLFAWAGEGDTNGRRRSRSSWPRRSNAGCPSPAPRDGQASRAWIRQISDRCGSECCGRWA